jgi:hypothetical protein
MLRVHGTFYFQIWNCRHQLRRCGHFSNAINPAVINNVLDVYFRNQAQSAAWYMGLVRDDNFTGLASTDTMLSHTGWEEGTEYDEATRPAWIPAAAASQIVINPTAATFTVNASQKFKGLFISSDNTIGGTAGNLWSTGLFGIDQEMIAGETLRAFYELSAREG